MNVDLVVILQNDVEYSKVLRMVEYDGFRIRHHEDGEWLEEIREFLAALPPIPSVPEEEIKLINRASEAGILTHQDVIDLGWHATKKMRAEVLDRVKAELG